MNPYVGSRFGVAAITTEMEIAADLPLVPLAEQPWFRTKGPAWWTGKGFSKNALNREPFADRRFVDGAHPFEKLKRVDDPTTYIDESRVARVPTPVLITGETGTGKEVVARALHDFSRRAAHRFVAINCAAVPETIFESEMFGHAAGAFTDAKGEREGKVEYADGGTLFLDEIESMPLALQAKILRVLQEREVERLGSNKARPVDIRVVAATKRDLKAESEAGLFHRVEGADGRVVIEAEMFETDFVEEAARLFVRTAVDRYGDDLEILAALFGLQPVQRRHFLPAGRAPCRPQIDQHRLIECGKVKRASFRVRERQRRQFGSGKGAHHLPRQLRRGSLA